MSEIKGFDKKQVPVAIASVAIVIISMICILIFGKSAGVNAPKHTDKESVVPSSKEVTSQNNQTKESSNQPISTTSPPPSTTTAPNMDYTVQSAIILQGNRAMEIYSIAPKSLANYGQVISTFASRVPKVNVYVLLAPTSVEFYGPESYRTGNHSQKKGIELAYSNLKGDNVKSVNVLPELSNHTGEYIYFRTDHHWTARGAYYAYRAFADVAGFTPTELSAHKTGKLEGFVGSMYTYTSAEILQQNPDYVEYFYPVSSASGQIFQDASMSNGRPLKIITENIPGKNKYLVFLSGDNPVEKIVSDNKNGRKIVVIKESYGNCFAPFLVDNFEEVYVLDPRKGDVNLTSFVKANGITDVLFINYTFVPSNATYKNALEKMLA